MYTAKIVMGTTNYDQIIIIYSPTRARMTVKSGAAGKESVA